MEINFAQFCQEVQSIRFFPQVVKMHSIVFLPAGGKEVSILKIDFRVQTR